MKKGGGGVEIRAGLLNVTPSASGWPPQSRCRIYSLALGLPVTRCALQVDYKVGHFANPTRTVCSTSFHMFIHTPMQYLWRGMEFRAKLCEVSPVRSPCPYGAWTSVALGGQLVQGWG